MRAHVACIIKASPKTNAIKNQRYIYIYMYIYIYILGHAGETCLVWRGRKGDRLEGRWGGSRGGMRGDGLSANQNDCEILRQQAPEWNSDRWSHVTSMDQSSCVCFSLCELFATANGHVC